MNEGTNLRDSFFLVLRDIILFPSHGTVSANPEIRVSSLRRILFGGPKVLNSFHAAATLTYFRLGFAMTNATLIT
jgi:hypothetical protein